MKTHSRFRVARGWLLFWCLFIGLGAVAGAVGMLVAPDGSAMGMQSMLPYFQVLPFAERLFQDFTFSGVALLCVNGLPNLLAAALMLLRRKGGVVLGGVFGVTLMLWIVIQFIIFPPNFMSTIYFFFGLAQALTGYAASVFDRQERFTVRSEDYPNIGGNPRALVVYFSRMGYTKRAAFEAANQSGAALYEVKSTERTEGTPGFWWCGRYGMHRWPMPICETRLDLEKYERVTICSPVWVFHLSAPMRQFCLLARGRIARFDCILTHHQRGSYESVVREMEEILGAPCERAQSVCCRAGRTVRVVKLRPAAR